MSKYWIAGWLLICWLPLQAAQPPEQEVEEVPQLWGYGTKGCTDYTASWDGEAKGDAEAAVDYLLYREWFSGLVSGLSLATGKDVLLGVDIKQAMGRVKLHCDEYPHDDFFNASMALVRLLSLL